MTAWQIAMALLIPVLAMQRLAGGNWPLHKARTWLVLIVASLLGAAVGNSSDTPPVLAFLLIDLAAAFAIIRRPSGCAQRWIGGMSILMACLHVGFALSAGHSVTAYYAAMSFLGWVQYGILALWSVDDAGKTIGRHHRFRGPLGAYWNAGPAGGSAGR